MKEVLFDFNFQPGDFASVVSVDNSTSYELKVKIVSAVADESDKWYYVSAPTEIIDAIGCHVKPNVNFEVPAGWSLGLLLADELEPATSGYLKVLEL